MFARHPEGLLIAQVNAALVSEARVTLADFDEQTWRKYFESRSAQYRLDGTGPQTRVTLEA